MLGAYERPARHAAAQAAQPTPSHRGPNRSTRCPRNGALIPALTWRAVMHHASVPSDTCRSSRIGTMKIEKTTGLSGAVIQFAQNETATITQP